MDTRARGVISTYGESGQQHVVPGPVREEELPDLAAVGLQQLSETFHLVLEPRRAQQVKRVLKPAGPA